MRTLIACNMTSLDGYYEGPGGDVMALPLDQAVDDYFLERMRAADTILLGARSYQGFMGFWPPQADNPEATEVQREIGRIWKKIDKVAISDSLTADDVEPWGATTTLVPRAEAESRVAALKEGPGREILVFGSRVMWTDLLKAGLVDQIHLLVGAGAVAGGTPLFDAPVTGLGLLDHRRIGADMLLLRYEVASR
jgi:dihydrofolate reductase